MVLDVKNEDLAEMLNLSFNEIHTNMRLYAKEEKIPIIQDDGLAFLETIIKLKECKSILEIGTAIGYCASRMQLASNGYIVTIERDNNMYQQAIKNIELLNLDDKIKVINKDALDAFDSVKDIRFDLIFIDAAKGQYQKFFEIYEPLLSANGVIVCDNMLFHGLLSNDAEIESRQLRSLIKKIKNFHNFLLNNINYNTSIFNIGDGISISIKK